MQMWPFITRTLLFTVFLSTISGCEPNGEQLLATTPNTEIFSNDLPISTQIQLYELSLTHYKQTILALQAHASQTKARTVAAEPIDFSVAAPIAPKHIMHGVPLWTQSEGNQETRIQWLCSYQSANCARTYQALMAFLPYLKGGYRLDYFHNPQRFQKFSNLSAHAELCLQPVPEKRGGFRQYLWQQMGNLTPQVIRTGLLQQALTPTEVEACLADSQHKQALSQLSKTVKTNQLPNKPSLWIDGVYVSQLHWASEFLPLFKTKLDTKGTLTLESAIEKNLLHQLPTPLFLKYVWQDQQSRHSWAKYTLKNSSGANQTVAAQLNLPFLGDTNLGWVYQITPQAITLYSQGGLINVPIASAEQHLADSNSATPHAQKEPSAQSEALTADTQSADPLLTDTQPEPNIHEIEDEAQRHKKRYEQAVAQAPVVPISGSWLEQQLLRQMDLEQQLESTDHEVEGHALLKLQKTDIDPFYQTLGMQPGDVIVRVNDQWIYEGNNPLWDLLQKENEISVSLIRKGLPVHLAFSKTQTD